MLVAAVADPALAEIAAGRANAGQVYGTGAAAAEQARSARQRVSALLQGRWRTGGGCGTGRLPSALADAYLELKAAGRL